MFCFNTIVSMILLFQRERTTRESRWSLQLSEDTRRSQQGFIIVCCLLTLFTTLFLILISSTTYNTKRYNIIMILLKKRCTTKLGGCPIKGDASWGFWPFFVKNGLIRTSLSYSIILEQREERNQLNSWKEQLTICSFEFWLYNMQPTIPWFALMKG